MQIKILDSWLRDYLKTNAGPREIARILSLSSVSVERLEKIGDDYLYDIEVTANRVDLMSVVGLAREIAAVLPEYGFKSQFSEPDFRESEKRTGFPIEIKNDPELVNRVCAVVLDVTVKQSPARISKRLEASGIRSLNNLVDITNYVMRETGHPAHVFDFDLLGTNKMSIRKSKKGEKIVTLDNKEYALLGEDIVMEDSSGRIVDLLGIMGLSNSVVSESTKKILFFIDNNEPKHIRNTSMSLGIRSEAAVLNEKGVDPELALPAIHRGIELYKEVADARVASDVLDIYPTKFPITKISLSLEKINKVIGEKILPEKSENILKKLGFGVERQKDRFYVSVPSFRRNDVEIEEDLIEEVARVYGFQNLKAILPPENQNKNSVKYDDEFYWEERVKNALKYWGFTETYTYSLVSEDLYLGPTNEALKIKNPLSLDMLYLRNSIIPSLISVVEDNKTVEKLNIFELANTYHKRPNKLPIEKLTLTGLMKGNNVSFFETKGITEALLKDLGIETISFKTKSNGVGGADIYIKDAHIGYIEILSTQMVDFELDFNKILKFATLKRKFRQLVKFPPVMEDISIVVGDASTADVLEEIKMQSELISEVKLLDEFENKKTFHIVYQSREKSLTKEEVAEVRRKIAESLKSKFNAVLA